MTKKKKRRKAQEIVRPGEYYQDCFLHPCLCTYLKGDMIEGISLVDGSSPRGCDPNFCDVVKLTFRQAMARKFYGPATLEEEKRIPAERQWWTRSLFGNPIRWPLPERLKTRPPYTPRQVRP